MTEPTHTQRARRSRLRRAPHSGDLHPRAMPRWIALLFAGLAALLVPWTIYLHETLPDTHLTTHYNLSWVGFDLLLLVALARTAWLALRRRRQVELPAVMTATLLIVDAWFDVTTAHHGWPRVEAILLAACVELPLAALCLALTRRVEWLTEMAEDITHLDLTPADGEDPRDREDESVSARVS